ncbi:ATP-dependent helicase HrpB [Neiella marina]|uniref:ATP-dependent helicase HrpB n=1 Tax=Neiella holothuriorum TaxID=2870530 RepID=A0ABS7EB13_9GAMM|nr:ATP-dependent helicase HrpB [Neiella holothuriorum]MBW8189520.1 ATP-dependent helicase HrpB [Neiella holothuriorum]
MNQQLPVFDIADEVASALLTSSQDVILTAPTGSGKSTLLPLLLLQHPAFANKRMLMLEPRRLAAMSVAQYMASQLGEPIGQRVGYQIRQQQKRSAATQLMVVTEGILTRLLQHDPELTDYDLVIFDECHERNLQADLAFALCLDAQQGLRDDLRLLLMSATLEIEDFKRCLPEARLISSEGRQFPVHLHYRMRDPKQAWLPQCFSLLKQATQEQPEGDVLVFVPGFREIQQLLQWAQETPELANTFDWMPLYGDLSPSEQQKIFHPGAKRRVIVATNIAETSITLPRVRTVVDSGFERTMRFVSSANAGRLQTKQISRASAQQRAGRAGRVAEGHCYRLWSEQQQQSFEPNIVPEVHYAELTQLAVELAQWGVSELDQLTWLTPPNSGHWQHAKEQLRWLKAVDSTGAINAHGRAMSQLGLAPRLAHLLVLASAEGDELLASACLSAALLEDKTNQRSCEFIRRVEAASSSGKRQQLQQAKQWFKRAGGQQWPTKLHTQGLVELLLQAFPDRVAKRRQQSTYATSDGVGVQLPTDDALQNANWLLVLQHQLSEFHADSWVRAAVEISPDLIEQKLGNFIESAEQVNWDDDKAKVIGRRLRKLGRLTLTSEPLTAINDHQIEQALCGWVKRKGLRVLQWTPAIANFCQRVTLAKRWQLAGSKDWPDFDEPSLLATLEHWLLPYLAGMRSHKALKQFDALPALRAYLGFQQAQLLDKSLPTQFETPLGRLVAIQYDADAGAKISVPMQEMYGCNDQVLLADGRCPLTFELLSPAKRPLQLTQNLPQFWQGSYREVQKEMKGRYPKHLWPDDPANTLPTRKTKRHL